LELADRSLDLMLVVVDFLELLDGLLEIVDYVLGVLGGQFLLSCLLGDRFHFHGLARMVPGRACQII
jgi:hypothetical protein